ncbi:response regulator transcription factor [Enterococcus alishanensis]|uniref:Response regulator transcription factor n=1 Tax=Enterococcus alishanensis TaxID=1303817 RepID=A0ABS6T8C7_9ENTE|nr:response regulator transcription factor [Enterococcus alishanensis]MBV7389052.1 response regulator transcription factor [Enterococcus alishanensis]
MKILIVEDEESLANFIETELKFEGYETVWASDGQEALTIFFENPEAIDLILLDWMLPKTDGITVARRIRKQSEVPIIMMTARDQTTDIVQGLDTGLDDYLTKPFEIEELFARIRVIERRVEKQKQVEQHLIYHGITMDVAKHQVLLNEQIIDLTPKEFGILYELMKEPEAVKTRDELLNEVWGYDYFGQTNVVDVYIRTLRNKLKAVDDENYLQTVRGVGYVLRVGE